MKPQEYGYWIGFRRPAASDIPAGWGLKRLHELATFAAGGRLGLTMSDYMSSGFDAYSAEGLNGKTSVAEFDGPAVIVSSIGARCGKCFLARGKFTTLANVQIVFPNVEILKPSFLWNVVNDERFWQRYATAQPFIRPSDIKESWIAVPPPNEQAAISGILDAADAAIERAREAVERARELERSILKEAIERLAAPKRRLGEFTSDVRYGTSKASSERRWGNPVLRIPNVVGDRLSLDDLATVELPEKEVARLRLNDGDLLLVRTNGNPNYVGRSVVFRHPDHRVWVYASYLIRVRLKCGLLPEFVNVFLGLEIGRRELLRRVTTSAGNHNINSNSIRLLSVPVPETTGAQEQVVRFARACRASVDALQVKQSALETLKKALMHDLLTGRVRVSAGTEAATA